MKGSTAFFTDESGNLRFTRQGRQEYGPYFASAGIDINAIRTLDAYYSAREAAAPFFLESLAERAATWPDTDEYTLLRTVISGAADEIQEAIERCDRKQAFRIIVNDHPRD